MERKSTPCHQYADKVISGEIEANKFIKLACKRFQRDLIEFNFSVDHYEHAVNFMQSLKHTTGRSAGENFKLELWQHFIVGNLFGFINESGLRRFKASYIEVPRKNGKSFLAAAVNLYGLFADEEEGAQIYCAATKLHQATIVFDEMVRICRRTDLINREILAGKIKVNNSVNYKKITHQENYAKPLEWSPDSMDGLNSHFCVIDEYHAHKTDEMFNVMMNSMGARSQPLLFTITTAGFNKISPCYKYRNYCTKLLEGIVPKNDSLFTLIYSIDENDKWTDESTWKKANPNYNISVYPEFLSDKFKEAKEQVGKEVEFKTKLLNVWTDSEKTWISDKHWQKCVASDELAVGPCYGGLDLASVSDFCAYSLFWPETNYLKTWYWLPEDAVKYRNDQASDTIREWAISGLIKTTDGNVTDHKFIRHAINEIAEQYGWPQEIAFDPYNSNQLVIGLQEDGFKMFKFRQGFISMSPPTKEFERLILSGKLKHDGNPCCRWQMSNINIQKDPAENIKIDKSKSGDKVDGPVSKVMAIGTWMDGQQNVSENAEMFYQII